MYDLLESGSIHTAGALATYPSNFWPKIFTISPIEKSSAKNDLSDFEWKDKFSKQL